MFLCVNYMTIYKPLYKCTVLHNFQSISLFALSESAKNFIIGEAGHKVKLAKGLVSWCFIVCKEPTEYTHGPSQCADTLYC